MTTRSTVAACSRPSAWRGDAITAADGTLLARSVRGPDGVYHRRYPQSGLFGHAVGYSFTTLGQAGLELARNGYLNGTQTTCNRLDPRPAAGQAEPGRRRHHDARSQCTAHRRVGAGRPARGGGGAGPAHGRGQGDGFDPGVRPQRARRPEHLQPPGQRRDEQAAGQPGTQFGYAPGSTFKVVTATAAIDSGAYSPGSVVDGETT